MSLLFVDDDAATREAVRRWLRQDDWNVEVAESGRHAFEKMIERRYDGLLLDLAMPGEGGIELLLKLAENEIYRPPTIILSGAIAPDIQPVRRLMDAFSINKFLSKPVHPAVLRLAVRCHFGGCL
jgi:DNA-binding response OmpR family regulator